MSAYPSSLGSLRPGSTPIPVDRDGTPLALQPGGRFRLSLFVLDRDQAGEDDHDADRTTRLI